MDKKAYAAIFIFIGLSILYVLLSIINFLTRGKWSNLVRKKITVGTLIISFSVLLGSAGQVFAQEATNTPALTPTMAPTPVCYTQPPNTPTPILTPTPMITRTPTPMCYTQPPNTPTPTIIPTSTCYTPAPTPTPTFTPMCYTPAPSFTPSPTPVTGTATGDVDNNGSVDIVDALKVARYSIGINVEGFDATQADVDKSGRIDIVDALCIAQKYVGIIDKYPDKS